MKREHLSPARGAVRTGLGAIALAAALAMATSACQSSSKASVVGQDQTTSSAAAVGAPKTGGAAATSSSAAGGTFKVGQQVKVGAFTVVVHKVTYPYTSDMDQPDAGKAYVLLDVEVTNTSSDSQDLSSMVQFGLADSSNTTYDETFVVGANGNPPEGSIAAGKALRGPVAFEVPSGDKGLQFSFRPGLSNDKIYIDLGK
ncbi:hypothetical protein ABH920_000653 [Catenulispora sp. EB89]|uniref:DUF4352 domain-containing protein n=1 Tax=Catenulispora sp. EB89 TaxID=3156257 RepID=UPI0035153275